MSNKKLAIILLAVAVIGVALFLILRSSGTSGDSSSVNTTPASQSQSTQNQTQDTARTFTPQDVAAHASETDCWTIVSGKVYDITKYVPRHPGGDDILLACGVDGTSLFTQRKTEDGQTVGSGTPHDSGSQAQLQQYFIGTLAQ